MKLTSRVAKRFFEFAIAKGFLNKILNLIPRTSIWEYIGPELKSEFARFAGDGYDELLYANHQLSPEDSVLVLGGYKGKSIGIWRDLYNCKIVAYEPIPEFFNTLVDKFREDSNILLFPYAVSGREELINFALAEEGTSKFLEANQYISIQAKDIFSELENINPYPRVIELNIEGGEYAVLKRMLESKSIEKIQTLLIQFHNYGYEEQLARAEIRLALSTTHTCEFSYEWLWERWTLRN